MRSADGGFRIRAGRLNYLYIPSAGKPMQQTQIY